MASSVATPLERQFSTIAGITSMNSTNSLGTTQITLQFDLDRNIDAAAQDVQAAISQSAPFLPPDMPSPPTFRKVNPADQPILYLGLTSRDAAAVHPRRIRRDAAGAAHLDGQRRRPGAGVRRAEVRRAHQARSQGAGQPRHRHRRGRGGGAVGQRQSADRHAAGQPPALHRAGDRAAHRRRRATEPLIVTYRDGRPVRLEELGRVIDSVEDDKTASWFADAEQAAALDRARDPAPTRHQHGRGRRERSRRCCRSSRRSCRRRSSCTSCSTVRESILASVNDVKFTMVLALVLVVMVIFLFLRNISATVIPSLALPLSIVGTFAVMYPLGYSIDNLSMMALTLSVGFVVDDAIVMLENIVRHMEMGEAPREAALNGSREIGFTILSMTLSLAAVFIPVLFMPGILGRLFHEFAVTICVAILISGFVSLSLTPMLCSRFLRPPREEHHGRFYQATERVFDALLRAYERSLQWVLRHRLGMMVASLLILVATVYLFVRIPKGFIPDEDQGAIFAHHRSGAGRVVRRHGAPPDGDRGHHPPGSERAGAVLHRGRLDRQRRHDHQSGPRLHPSQAARRAAEHCGGDGASCGPRSPTIPGLRVFLQQMPTIRIGGQLTKSLYQFTLQGPTRQELYAPAEDLERKMRGARHPAGRDQRPAGAQPARSTCRSIATTPRRSASPPSRSRARSTAPTATAGSRRSTRRRTSTR